jgi:hypothetical protein
MSKEQYAFPHEDSVSLDKFYGNPRGRNGRVSSTWYKNHIVNWKPPYPIFYSDGHQPMRMLLVHKLCVPAFDGAFTEVLNHFGPDAIKEKHLDICGGTYNYRNMRGGSRLSVHAYGIAIDMDPENNPFPHRWTEDGIDLDFVKIMEKHGFWWRGHHGDIDPMHFQCTFRGQKPEGLESANPVEPATNDDTVDPHYHATDPIPPVLVHPEDHSIPGTIYKFFCEHDLTPAQACGIVANVQAESGFDINNVGDGGLARGLFQMHPDRRSVIWEGARCDMKHGNIEEQCKGALWELHHVELHAYRKLKQAETPFVAGYNMCRYYERPASHLEWIKRGRIAEKWFHHFND